MLTNCKLKFSKSRSQNQYWLSWRETNACHKPDFLMFYVSSLNSLMWSSSHCVFSTQILWHPIRVEGRLQSFPQERNRWKRMTIVVGTWFSHLLFYIRRNLMSLSFLLNLTDIQSKSSSKYTHSYLHTMGLYKFYFFRCRCQKSWKLSGTTSWTFFFFNK